MATPRAFVFDAYGTLFDVHSVVEAARALTSDPEALSQLWRQKQLEYTWLRSLMGRYEDFLTVSRESLEYTLATLGLRAEEALIARLVEAYDNLSPYAEFIPRSGRALIAPPTPATPTPAAPAPRAADD